jgi:repressor LexA
MKGKSKVMPELYTQRQGQYLAFIHYYTRLHGYPPAESDLQAYFGVSGPAVHQMIVTLGNRGLIQRVPGQARAIRILLPPETLPDLEGHPPPAPSGGGSFGAAYPHIAAWIARDGWIESRQVKTLWGPPADWGSHPHNLLS